MKVKRSLLDEFVLGLQHYGKALQLFWKHRLFLYLFFPLIFNLLLFIIGFAAVGELTDYLIDLVDGQYKLRDIEIWGADGIGEFLYWFLWFVLKIIYFFIYSILSGNIIMIFMSPVLAFLSERVEMICSGKDYPFKLKNFIREAIRGLVIAIRNMFWQIAWMIIFFILGFIPLFGAIVPFAIIIVSSYFYGFSFLDYNNERKQLPISKSVRFMRVHKALAVANGLPFTIILLIPLIGGIIASFFSILSVIAASSVMSREEL